MIDVPTTKAIIPIIPASTSDDLVLSPVRRIALLNTQPATPKPSNMPTNTLLIS